MNSLRTLQRLLLLCVLACGLVLSGCATTKPGGQEHVQMERFNRSMHAFNDALDQGIVKPVAEGYQAVTPEVARTGVSNFFGNLRGFWSTFNKILQFRPLAATKGALRNSFNTVLGLGGLIDISTPMGLYEEKQDLGKTLGYWGVPSGPYVVLPVLGPTTLRDIATIPVERQYDLVSHIEHIPSRNSATGLRLLNTRANLLSASNVLEETALDKYAFTRNAFLQKRQNEIDNMRESLSEDDEDEFL